jgi:hypothetical protein
VRGPPPENLEHSFGVCILGVIRDTSSLDFPSYVWILKAMERCCVWPFYLLRSIEIH